MSPLVALMVVGLGVTAAGIVVQARHARVLLQDRRLLLHDAPPEAIELIQIRLRIGGVLGLVHVLVASAAAFHLVTHSPLQPIAADYWSAAVRVLISLLVLLSTLSSLSFRHRLTRRE